MKIYCQNVWNYHATEQRNGLIASLVKAEDADLCLFQECGPESIRATAAPLPALLSDRYAEVCPQYAGVNYTPVFYKPERFDVIDSGYVLYDGLNDVNSKSITWAVLRDKTCGKQFAAVSTHFWWKFSSEADFSQRLQNVQQLKAVCDGFVAKHGVPVIVGGDFNNGKNADQGEEPYRAMLQQGFRDVRLAAPDTTDAFTHRDGVANAEGILEAVGLPMRTLDHLFVYGPENVTPVKFDVLLSQEALASSDHCPLVGVFGV